MSFPGSLKMLLCLFVGHRDVQVTLILGKLVPEKIEVTKCERCNRILVPIAKLNENLVRKPE